MHTAQGQSRTGQAADRACACQFTPQMAPWLRPGQVSRVGNAAIGCHLPGTGRGAAKTHTGPPTPVLARRWWPACHARTRAWEVPSVHSYPGPRKHHTHGIAGALRTTGSPEATQDTSRTAWMSLWKPEEGLPRGGGHRARTQVPGTRPRVTRLRVACLRHGVSPGCRQPPVCSGCSAEACPPAASGGRP